MVENCIGSEFLRSKGIKCVKVRFFLLTSILHCALEISLGAIPRGFESHRLRQKKTDALIQSIGLFQRNKSLTGFVKYASHVKYCFAM